MISHFPKHNVFFLSLFAGMTILLLATSRYVTAQDTADVIIATVNDEPIYQGSLLAELKSLLGETPTKSEAYQRLRSQVLQGAIQRRLALAYLERINQRASDDDIKLGVIRLEKRLALKNQTLKEYLNEKQINREELEHQIAWQISWPKYSRQLLTDKNYENFFNQRRMQFDGTQLLVSQILLHVKQEPTRTEKQTLALAEKLLARIREKEITFAEAARQFSDSPTGQKGGIVGLIEFNGAMPREFNTAAFKLKPGEISEPVKTAFGYHLIKLNDVTQGTITWQMARPSLRKALIAHLLNFLTEEGRKISTVELSEDWE